MTSQAKTTSAIAQCATAYLCARDAARAIEFYQRAFDATEVMRLTEPSGKIGHAELKIGDAHIALADEYPELGNLSPQSPGGSPVTIHVHVEDVDALARQAVAAGATLLRPVADQFYGERIGRLADPFGYVWVFATHTEHVTPAEMQRRYGDLLQQQGGASGPAPEGATAAVKSTREGFHTVTPYLMVREAARLLDFVKQAFGATELLRTTGSAGGMHAEVRIGDSMVMIGGAGAPGGEPMPAAIYLYLPDVDAVYRRALAAGATSIGEPEDQPYGDRVAGVKDAFGNIWYIATHL